MRFLPTRVHAVIDYLWGLVLLVSPSLLGFGGTAATVAYVFGAGAILYSLLTDYELGLVRVLPMRVHLGFDALAGGVLALLPLLLGLSGSPAWLFGLLGAGAVVAAFVTRVRPAG